MKVAYLCYHLKKAYCQLRNFGNVEDISIYYWCIIYAYIICVDVYFHIHQYITYKYILLHIKLAIGYVTNAAKVPFFSNPSSNHFHPLPSITITTGHDYCTIHTHSVIMIGDAKEFCFCALHFFS